MVLRPSSEPKILSCLIKLKAQGLSDSSLESISDKLMHIARNVDIDRTDDVNTFISTKSSIEYKSSLTKTYSYYVQAYGLSWNKPKYKPKMGIPRPPTTEQVKELIAGASKKYAPIFKLMSEVGASPIEVSIMDESSFDYERKLVYIKGMKGHLDRLVPINDEIMALMKLYFTEYQRFPSNVMMGKKFRKYRDLLAKKLKDKALRNVRLYDLRHYFGTMTYYRTKDILYTKDVMGHRKLETTLIYTKLIAYGDEQYICRIAKTLEEASQLIE